MFKTILAMFGLSLNSCSLFLIEQKEGFQLQDGSVIECLSYVQTECGMELINCTESESLRLQCMQNIRYLGPVDTD